MQFTDLNLSDELFDLHTRIGNLARDLHACQEQIARLYLRAIERDLPTAIASRTKCYGCQKSE